MHLLVRVRLLGGSYLGMRDNDAEWPPSPYRLFNALIDAANARKALWSIEKEQALRWFEHLPPPDIITPDATKSVPFLSYVPNNDSDLVMTGKKQAADICTAKEVCETLVGNGEIVYVWPIPEMSPHVGTLIEEAQYLSCLGRGETHAVCKIEVTEDQALMDAIPGIRWKPGTATFEDNLLRIPVPGTYESLEARFQASKHALVGKTIDTKVVSVPNRTVSYTMEGKRRFTRLVLHDENGDMTSVPSHQAATVAALIRHECLQIAESEGIPNDVIQEFVRGVIKGEGSRMSYVPMPSIGMAYTDEMIRRAIVCEPTGLPNEVFTRISERLGRTRNVLRSGDGKVKFILGLPSRSGEDRRMFRRYTTASRVWQTLTPAVLPRHITGGGGAQRRLPKALEKMLEHAGYVGMVKVREVDGGRKRHAIDVSQHPFTQRGEWSSRYQTPTYMEHLPRVHVRVEFKQPVEGPVLLGNGRHCGLGVCARVESE